MSFAEEEREREKRRPRGGIYERDRVGMFCSLGPVPKAPTRRAPAQKQRGSEGSAAGLCVAVAPLLSCDMLLVRYDSGVSVPISFSSSLSLSRFCVLSLTMLSRCLCSRASSTPRRPWLPFVSAQRRTRARIIARKSRVESRARAH